MQTLHRNLQKATLKPASTLLTAILLCGVGAHSQAAITAEEAARLGTELTPIGADPAGNAAGTIPPWTGGLTTPPSGFKPGGDYINPFADEKPLYVITAANMAEHEQYLTEGTKALLKRFPDTYKVPVYPTHRTAALPPHVYEQIKSDAQSVQLVDNGDGIISVGTGRVPFPIPKTGVELLWNLGNRYFGDDLVMNSSNFPVQSNGAYTAVKTRQWKVWAPALFDDEEFGIKVFYEMFSPASVAGLKIVTHEPNNMAKTPRQTWTFNPGQRRVLRAPEISYDTPISGSDGLVTNDATDCFSGGKDRYDWTLVGKQELIVPYNNYDLNANSTPVADIIGAQHINPDYMRYELHRVWVVDANLRQGKRNIFSKRRYYLDEDSYTCSGVDMYDGRGELWRVIVPSNMQMYDHPVMMMRAEAHYDLQANRYYAGYVSNGDAPWTFNNNARTSEFTTNKLRRAGH